MGSIDLITEKEKEGTREKIGVLTTINGKANPLDAKDYFRHLHQNMYETERSIENLCINPIYKRMHDYLTEELPMTITLDLPGISFNDYNVWLTNLRFYNEAKSFLAGMYACYKTRVLFNKKEDSKDATEVVWEEVKGLVLGCIQSNTFNFPLDYDVK